MQAGIGLCNLEDIAPDSALGFDLDKKGRDTLFIVRTGAKVFAYRDECPHYKGSTSLPWRKDAYLDSKAEFIICASHGAEFEIHTGLCVRGPCVGESLNSVPVHLAQDGTIFIEL
ncbi:MAG: Rieske (2Fe-2S) protein [Halioglobus sp.]